MSEKHKHSPHLLPVNFTNIIFFLYAFVTWKQTRRQKHEIQENCLSYTGKYDLEII